VSPKFRLAPISKRSPADLSAEALAQADRPDLRRLAPADFHLPNLLVGFEHFCEDLGETTAGFGVPTTLPLSTIVQTFGKFLRKSGGDNSWDRADCRGHVTIFQNWPKYSLILFHETKF